MRAMLAALLCVSLFGCAFAAPVVPPVGSAYTNIAAPIDIDADPSELGSRVGKGSVTAILGLVAWGDASLAAAARDGGVKTIRHVDYEYTNVLFFYQRFTTVVRGD